MSHHSKDDKALPLPRPGSPAQLDERILSRAREQAGGDRTRLAPSWWTGLAATAVVMLAIFVTQLAQPPVTHSPGEVLDEAEMVEPAAMAPEPPGRERLEMKAMESSSAQPTSSAGARAIRSAKKQELLAFDSELAEEQAVAAIATPDPAPALAEIAQLLAQGKPAEAQQALERLRRECPGCDIPDSLDDLSPARENNELPEN